MGGVRFVAVNLVLAVVFAFVAFVVAEADAGSLLLAWFTAGVAVGALNWLWLRLRRPRRVRRQLQGIARIVVIGSGVVVVTVARVFLGPEFVPVLLAFGSGVVLIGAFPPRVRTR